MYFPLQLRLTLFYAVLLGLALWLFGSIVYTRAEHSAYPDLDTTLSSRSASVSLGKGLLSGQNKCQLPGLLQSVDAFGGGGVAIEVMDNQLNLRATTTGNSNGPFQTAVGGLGTSPIPLDNHAVQWVLQHPPSDSGETSVVY